MQPMNRMVGENNGRFQNLCRHVPMLCKVWKNDAAHRPNNFYQMKSSCRIKHMNLVLHIRLTLALIFQLNLTNLGGEIIEIIVARRELCHGTGSLTKGSNAESCALAGSCESSKYNRHSTKLDHFHLS